MARSFFGVLAFFSEKEVLGCSVMNTPQRRLSDKILSAFDQACERGELDVAEMLVRALELTLTRTGGKGSVDQRIELGPVVETYARLKQARGVAGAS
jgi:hypothetical protein